MFIILQSPVEFTGGSLLLPLPSLGVCVVQPVDSQEEGEVRTETTCKSVLYLPLWAEPNDITAAVYLLCSYSRELWFSRADDCIIYNQCGQQ